MYCTGNQTQDFVTKSLQPLLVPIHKNQKYFHCLQSRFKKGLYELVMKNTVAVAISTDHLVQCISNHKCEGNSLIILVGTNTISARSQEFVCN